MQPYKCINRKISIIIIFIHLKPYKSLINTMKIALLYSLLIYQLLPHCDATGNGDD